MATSSEMTYSFTTLDVFTTSRFSGNPLAIVHVPLKSPLSQDQKQRIAREFNLSETVFLHEAEPHSAHRTIDIFITTAELPFAGHPIIGTVCYILGSEASGADQHVTTQLVTKAGRIPVTYDPQSQIAEASIPHNVHVHSKRVSLNEIKRVQPDVIPPEVEHQMSESFPVVSIVKGMTFALVKLPSLDALKLLRTGGGALRHELDQNWDSVLLAPYFYVQGDDDTDGTVRLRTRMIEPGCGEDPATGSAACTLATYIALQTGEKGNLWRFSIEQGVEMGRRSFIGVKVRLNAGGDGIEEVILSGSAVSVMEGRLSA